MKNYSVEDLAICLQTTLSEIREQFNEHLEAINQNTNEIQGNYEYLVELDSKINKLAERIEEISLFVGMTKKCEVTKEDFSLLTFKEKEVFMAIYTMTEVSEFVSYKDIARRLALTEGLVANYVTNLLEKGIPLTKRYVNGEVRLSIPPEFRRLQAKENVLGISELVSQRVSVQ